MAKTNFGGDRFQRLREILLNRAKNYVRQS
jgi:hypothetical protein